MTTKHTPGPWKFIGDGLFGGVYTARDGLEYTSFQIHPFYDSDRTQGIHGQRHEADKRLIAAAPRLISALRELELCTRQLIAGELGSIPSALLPRCREIIEQATGEPVNMEKETAI